MKIILGKCGSGKTTWLLQESAKTGIRIMVISHQRKLHVESMAKCKGIDIPEPIEIGAARNFRTPVLIDDCDQLINYIIGNVAGITMTSDDINSVETL